MTLPCVKLPHKTSQYTGQLQELHTQKGRVSGPLEEVTGSEVQGQLANSQLEVSQPGLPETLSQNTLKGEERTQGLRAADPGWEDPGL